ncbi:hypothetical protein [Acinetobacter indicus]|uniref:hypothetical protein n=1 Tax=Acinetobacter indicus TaxID=756892 RepID=UPI00209AE75D|nr:hypothetical protein [Acinetobacter indicus]MCO8088261.1 hypothetical protein [Acinetobacter indicus]
MAKKFVLAELSDQHEFILKIKEILAKATKQAVAFIAVDKLSKKAGVAVRTVTITFEEGQTLSLVFRTDGDVIQTKLNNKAIPLSKVMDYDKMSDFTAGLEDLALKLKANQEKFNIKRQNAKVIVPRAKNPSLSVKKRIQLARERLAEMEEVLAKKRALLAKKKEDLSVIKGAAA